MKIKFEFVIDTDDLESARQSWQHNEETLPTSVQSILDEHIDELYVSTEEALRQRFEDDAKAANPDLEEAKKEIIRTLYLYGQGDKHNRMALFDVLSILDPGLARQVTDQGADKVWDERFEPEEDV